MSSHRFEPPKSAFFEGWARTLLRHRFVALLLCFGVTGWMAERTANTLVIDNRNEVFIPEKSAAAMALQDLRADFGNDGLFLLLVEGDVFTPRFLDHLRTLHREVDELQVELSTDVAEVEQAAAAPTDDFGDFGDDSGWGDETGGSLFEEIISLVNVRETTYRDEGLHVAGLLDEWPTPDELPALEQRVLANKTLVGQVVGKEGQHAMIVARIPELGETDATRVYDALMALAHKHSEPGFEVGVGGLPAFYATISRGLVKDLTMLSTGEVLVMLFLMILIFRHPLGVGGPLMVVGQSTVWMLGTMAVAGIPLTMISGVLISLVLCVGIGAAVHVQSVYRDARRDGLDNDPAIVEALATTGLPILFTTLTTCVGLLSFQFADIEPIRHLGRFGAIGVAYALVQSLVFLPIVLTFNKKSLLGVPPKQRDADFLDRVLVFCNSLSRGSAARTWATVGMGAAIAIAALIGIQRMEVYHDPLTWFPPDSNIVRTTKGIDQNVGGSSNVSLLITAPEGKDLRDRDLLVGLEKLEAHSLAFSDPRTDERIVGNATSVLDVVRETSRALHGDDQAFYRVPETQQGVTDVFTLFQNSGPEELKRLSTVDLQRGVMTLRVQWRDASSYWPLAQHIEQGARNHLNGLAKVQYTGSVFNMVSVVGSLLRDLIWSFSTALCVIAVMMVILLRDPRLGLIAMVPNLWPIACMMGYMGFAGVPLDVNNVLLASIAIGIAVDDTIHFLHQFRKHYLAYGDVDAAIDHSFSHAGRALLSTSAILASGFLIFLFAFMSNTRVFGTLAAMAVCFALLADLILTPALLRVLYKSRPVQADQSEPDHGTGTPSEAPAAG